MYKKVFLDVNILIDYMDADRSSHGFSTQAMRYLLLNGSDLLTSCDIMTTLYYLGAKKDRAKALYEISQINSFCYIIDFSNKEISFVCQLMQEDQDYRDLEDTTQYILAQKEKCDLILSNDKNFVSKGLKLMSSKAFCTSVGIDNDA